MVSATRNLSRYREIETLGSGGMATVVLAQDTLLGREVALKRMHTAADPSGAARLRREALVGASISHPNLVSVYDVVATDDGDVVIVMEYVAGENLRDALARGRPPVPETLRMLEGVAAGLNAIHERGIVHRDIKPANILLGRGGAVKIADLGIASAPDRTRITTVGTVLGSFSYMAPEQLEDGAVSPAIDVYALATVAYEALSGVAAHRESTPIAIAHAIATQPAPDVRDVWPQAPAPVAEVLRRGMARDPAQRPRSATELIARLRAALDQQPTRRVTPAVPPAPPRAAPVAAAAVSRGADASPPPDPPGARRATRALVPLALVLLALGVIAAVLLAGNSSSPTTSSSASHTTRPPTHRTSTRAKSTPPATSTHSHSTSTPSTPTQSTPTSSTPTSSTPTSSTPTTTSTPSTTSTPPAGTATSPTTAVSSFYELAASHRYSDAWALADPVFRSQLGGYQSFVNGQSGDRQIIFHTDRVISQSAKQATVQVATTSVRDNGTQQCHGTVSLQNESSAGWLLHAIAISCT